MLKNFIITSFRNLLRNRTYALLNIFGLALGIGCVLVIYKTITYELSFDKHQSNYQETYRLVREKTISTGITYNQGVPHPLGKALRSDFPDFVSALVHYNYGGMLSTVVGGDEVRYQEEEGVAFAENEILQILDFEFVAGDRFNALNDPGSTIVSEGIVKKYFGLESGQLDKVIGKTMQLENEIDLRITAVIKDHPKQTDFPFNVIINYASQDKINPYFGKGENWHNNSGSTNCLMVVPSAVSITNLEAKFPAFIDKYYGENVSEDEKYVLQPLSEIHFDTNYENYSGQQLSDEMLIAFSMIGLFLLISASINFVNLSTAQAVKRSKEVGIRKTLGGVRMQLVSQFMCETLLITTIAAFIGLMIAEVLLIHLEEIIGYSVHLNLIHEPLTIVFLIGLVVVIGVLAGLYPSWIMSKMDPVLAMKNNLNSRHNGGFLSLRRILVILQFSISQVLIIGTLVVSYQMDYFLSKDLGFEKEAIIDFGLPDNSEESLNKLKTGLLSSSDIHKVSYCLSAPLGASNSFTNFWHTSLDKDQEYLANFKAIDEEYLDLFGLKLIAGRGFYKSDSSNTVLINRKISRLLGYTNPEDAIGDEIGIWTGNIKIIGVVEDFHTQPLRGDIEYTIMLNFKSLFYNAQVKINTQNKTFSDIQRQIKFIENEWLTVFPNNIFDHRFYSERLEERYEEEKDIAQLIQLFSIIAIFIGCLGLYGLIAFISNQKTKEIGIRKVLGASIWNILRIFSKELIVLIAISFAIAGPFGFYVMSSWLDNYVYSISLTPGIFIVAILSSIVIALITSAYKSISASLANPVISLKDE